MVYNARAVEYIIVWTEEEALILEEQMIKQYLPEYNRLLKYNSKYVRIRYSVWDFPKVSISRKRREDKATYIWPKASSKELYNIMRYLRSIYKRRTMPNAEFKKWKLNLDFHLWLDAGRSAMAQLKGKNKEETIAYAEKYWLVLEQPYDYYVNMYKENLNKLKATLEGDTQGVLDDISTHIETHIDAQNYEYCAKLRDVYTAIENIQIKRQNIALNVAISGYICKIEVIHQYRVMILIKLHAGTIVDVIREQMKIEEADMYTIRTQLDAEFHMNHVRKESSSWCTVYEKSIVGLGKKNRNKLDTLLEWFLDSFVNSSLFGEDSLLSDILIGLQERYSLHYTPYHIECLDISHFAWDNVSAWLSCMIWWAKYPKWYRNYKIQSLQKGKHNDYQSLSEVLVRRFGLGKIDQQYDLDQYPDLFILDGGIWQLGILRKLREEFPELTQIETKTQFVSLGKWSARSRKGKQSGVVEELYMYDKKGSIYSKPLLYDQIDRILINIRDESHRFANRYRKKRSVIK